MGEGVDVGRWWIVMTAPCAGRNAGGPRRRLAIPEGVGERAAFESREPNFENGLRERYEDENGGRGTITYS